MNQRLRGPLALLALLVAGCAAAPGSGPRGAAAPAADATAAFEGRGAERPPPPLVPQPEGTPLPPRDPRIALRWPPEIRQVVDDMLALFPKQSDGRRVPIEEIERRMQLKVTELPAFDDPLGRRRFEVSGTPFTDPRLKRIGIGESYTEHAGLQSLTLAIGPRTTGYCLDPYELAVYTGDSYINGDMSVHMQVRQWHPARVWGMFSWSKVNTYIGSRLTIGLGLEATEGSLPSAGKARCVLTINASGSINQMGSKE